MNFLVKTESIGENVEVPTIFHPRRLSRAASIGLAEEQPNGEGFTETPQTTLADNNPGIINKQHTHYYARITHRNEHSKLQIHIIIISHSLCFLIMRN